MSALQEGPTTLALRELAAGLPRPKAVLVISAHWETAEPEITGADIPVIQLSVQAEKDAVWHYALGRAPASLRQEGVLIIGSGNLTHNLREVFRHHEVTPAWVSEFADWVAEKVAGQDIAALSDWQIQAPFAIKNHPTPEHFLPFFAALGAGGAENAKRLNPIVELGVLAMDAYLFEG